MCEEETHSQQRRKSFFFYKKRCPSKHRSEGDARFNAASYTNYLAESFFGGPSKFECPLRVQGSMRRGCTRYSLCKYILNGFQVPDGIEGLISQFTWRDTLKYVSRGNLAPRVLPRIYYCGSSSVDRPGCQRRLSSGSVLPRL